MPRLRKLTGIRIFAQNLNTINPAAMYPHRPALLLLTLLLLTSCGFTRFAALPSIGGNTSHRTLSALDSTAADSLLALYGNNKTIPGEYLHQALLALSYYPELKDTRIEFRYSDEKTTMAARPVIGSLFCKRRYLVLINNDPDFDGIPLDKVPFNAQVGVIGHELAHIADYESRNLWGILEVLFSYAGPRHKPHFERTTDKETIIRGLGWQLYDWAVYSMEDNPYATEAYKDFKRRHYMSPDEILAYIGSLSTYRLADTR